MGPTTHQGTPWCLVGPTGLLWCTSWAPLLSSGHKKFSKKFHGIWTPFGIDILQSKTKQKTAIGTRHYVNRLVPKNDIK